MTVINNSTFDVFLNRFPQKELKEFSLIYKTLQDLTNELKVLKKSSTPAPENPIGALPAPAAVEEPNYKKIDDAATTSIAANHPELAAKIDTGIKTKASAHTMLAPYKAGYFGPTDTGMIVTDISGKPQLGRVARAHLIDKKLFFEGTKQFQPERRDIGYYIKFADGSTTTRPSVSEKGEPLDLSKTTISTIVTRGKRRKAKTVTSEVPSDQRNAFKQLFKDHDSSIYLPLFKDGLSDSEYEDLKTRLFSDDGFLWKHFSSTHPLNHVVNFLSGLAPHISSDKNTQKSILSICDGLKTKIASDYQKTPRSRIQSDMLQKLDRAREFARTGSLEKLPYFIPRFKFSRTINDPATCEVSMSYHHDGYHNKGQVDSVPIDLIKFSSLFDNLSFPSSGTKFAGLLQKMTNKENWSSVFGNVPVDIDTKEVDGVDYPLIDKTVIANTVRSPLNEKSLIENAETTLDKDQLPYDVGTLSEGFDKDQYNLLSIKGKYNILKTISNLRVQDYYKKINQNIIEEIEKQTTALGSPRIHEALKSLPSVYTTDIQERYPSLYNADFDPASILERHQAHQDLYLRSLLSSLKNSDPSAILSAINNDDYKTRIGSMLNLLPKRNGTDVPWNLDSGPFMARDSSPSFIIKPDFEYYIHHLNVNKLSNKVLSTQPFVTFSSTAGQSGGALKGSIKDHDARTTEPLGLFHALNDSSFLHLGILGSALNFPNKKRFGIENSEHLEMLLRAIKAAKDSKTSWRSTVPDLHGSINETIVNDSLANDHSDDSKKIFTNLLNGSDQRIRIYNDPRFSTITDENAPVNAVVTSARRFNSRPSFNRTPFDITDGVLPGPFAVQYKTNANGLKIPEFRIIYTRLNERTGKSELFIPTKPSDVGIGDSDWIPHIEGQGSKPDGTPNEPDGDNFIMFPSENSDIGDGLLNDSPIHKAHYEYRRIRQKFFEHLFSNNAHGLQGILPDMLEASMGNVPTPIVVAPVTRRRGLLPQPTTPVASVDDLREI